MINKKVICSYNIEKVYEQIDNLKDVKNVSRQFRKNNEVCVVIDFFKTSKKIQYYTIFLS